MLVTLAGHDILTGRTLLRPTTAGDYANFIVACLTHDIGYVRGVVQGDEDESYIADVTELLAHRATPTSIIPIFAIRAAAPWRSQTP